MRVVYEHEEADKLAFIRKAAEHFSKDKKCYSYTRGDIEDGGYLALRWGMHNRAICLLKLDEAHEPVIFGDAISYEKDEG